MKRVRGDDARLWFISALGQPPEILRRSDFLKVLTSPKPPREQLACCLAMRQGFRAGEVVMAQMDDIDLPGGVVYCRDSKLHKLFPLPLATETAYAYDHLLSPLHEMVYVLGRHPRYRKWRDRPVTLNQYGLLVKRWARDAGARDWPTWKPTMLRAFFAKEWARRGGDITLLSKMMRHHSPFTTFVYLKRFIYTEDLARELDRLSHPQPIMEVANRERIGE